MALHYHLIATLPVVPAKAGTHWNFAVACEGRSNGKMDPGFRRDDGLMCLDPGFRRDDGLMCLDPGFRRDDGLMCLDPGVRRDDGSMWTVDRMRRWNG